MSRNLTQKARFLRVAGVALAGFAALTGISWAQDVGVFVSSSLHTSRLGGLVGADRICHRLGNAKFSYESQGFPGIGWRAWLSDSSTNARDRIPTPGVGGRYVRATQPWVVIANDLADLTDGSLGAPILLDENGVAPPSASRSGRASAWTGSDREGNKTGKNCADWQDDGESTSYTAGTSELADGNWTLQVSGRCNDTRYHLYCFGVLQDPDADLRGRTPASVLVDAKHKRILTAGWNYDGNVYHQDHNPVPSTARWTFNWKGGSGGGYQICDEKHRKCLFADDGRLFHKYPTTDRRGLWHLEVAASRPALLTYLENRGSYNPRLVLSAGNVADNNVYLVPKRNTGKEQQWHQVSGSDLESDLLRLVPRLRLEGKIAVVGTATAYTEEEFRQGLEKENLTLVKSGTLGENECAIVYYDTDKEDTSARFGVLACAKEIADGVSLETKLVYGGCDVANNGVGSECTIGVAQDVLKLQYKNLTEELTIEGPKAGYCEALSEEFTCLNAGADVIGGAVKITDTDGNGAGIGASVGVGGGVDASIRDGVFAGGFEIKAGLGVKVNLSIAYEKNGKAVYQFFSDGVSYVKGQEPHTVVAGAVTGTARDGSNWLSHQFQVVGDSIVDESGNILDETGNFFSQSGEKIEEGSEDAWDWAKKNLDPSDLF